MPKLCAICSQPIDGNELLLNRDWHFDCEKCAYCNESMSGGHDQIRKCLESKIPVSHSFCFEQAKTVEIRQKFAIDFSHLLALNSAMTRHNWEPAAGQETQDYLHECLIKMQEFCANISYVLTCVRDKNTVVQTEKYRQEEKVKRDIAKHKAAETEAEKIERQKKTEMFAKERENPQLRAMRKSIEAFMKLGIAEDVATEMVRKQMRLGPEKQ